MDNEVEAGTERVCHHIRGPLASSGKLLNKNAGNTVNETLPIKDVRESMTNLRMDKAFAERNVNEGFSGGEKKRNEILQLELLRPRFAVLDETDSGLDVDALKIVAEGVNRAKANTGLGILLITHYTRILRYIKPDFVHVFVDGRIKEQGGPELADRLEDEGYDRFLADSNVV